MSIFGSPKFDPLGSVHQVGATNLNKMGRGMDSHTIRAGRGTMMQQTPGGSIVSVKRRYKQENSRDAFEPYRLRKDETGWKIRVEPGFVIEGNDKESKPIISVEVEIDGVLITDEPPPELSVAAADEVYLIIVTDENGVIVGQPTIEVDDGLNMVSYNRSLERDGLYKILLFDMVDTGEANPRIEVGTIFHKGSYIFNTHKQSNHPCEA